MSNSPTPENDRAAAPRDDVEAREREKLDIGDSHPEDREIGPEPRKHQGDELDIGDPHPADRDV